MHGTCSEPQAGQEGESKPVCIRRGGPAPLITQYGTREGPEPRSPRHQSWEQLSFFCLASKETVGVKVGTYMARTLMALPKTMSRAHADFLGSDPCASLALHEIGAFSEHSGNGFFT